MHPEELIERALDLDSGVALEATRRFFREVVEPNCDSFDRGAADEYARLFASVIGRGLPGYREDDLLRRYENVRRVRRYEGRPQRVCVLSRVTLGADVAVTSVMLDAAKQRFPDAKICLVGPVKNLELFAGDGRVVPVAVPYGRAGALRERLEASEAIRAVVDAPGTLVIDPDSRLTQLGMIPICDDERYLYFESRAYCADSRATLSALAAGWANETLGVREAKPYLTPLATRSDAAITVSLGVGENEEKRAGDELEAAAVSRLVSFGVPMVIDRGAGGEEAQRVERIVRALGDPKNLRVHEGSFASFASQIMQSKLYFGYDSAGQHVAAASGVALVTVFAGYACERTFDRWRPAGSDPIYVIKAAESERDLTQNVLAAIISAAEEAGLS